MAVGGRELIVWRRDVPADKDFELRAIVDSAENTRLAGLVVQSAYMRG